MKKILLLTAVVLGACMLFGSAFISKETVVEPVTAQVTEIQKNIPTHRQDIYMSLLENCESGGRHTIKILDSNDKYSYGSFQFQMPTFLHYGKKYNVIPQKTTEKEAEERYIYDFAIQREIVHNMLEDNLHNNWMVCYHKINAKYPKDTSN